MNTSPDRQVEIQENGRSGSVIYRERGSSLPFHWEFGGGDVLVIIQVNNAAEWKTKATWMGRHRSDILRFVADEVIRQKAPGTSAEIDEKAGTITLRQTKPDLQASLKPTDRPLTAQAASKVPGQAPARKEFSMTTWRRLRTRFAIGVLIASTLFSGMLWFKNQVLSIDPGKGTPVGLVVRTDTHIASLIRTLEPYTPSLHRDASKDRYRFSVYLVPLDGSDPQHIPILGGASANSFSLAKILGSDGRTLWFEVDGIGGVDLQTSELVTIEDLSRINPSLDAVRLGDLQGVIAGGRLRLSSRDRQQVVEFDAGTRKAVPATTQQEIKRSPFDPGVESYLLAGFFTTPTTWLGLHSPTEVERVFKPDSWLKRVVRADDTREMRQFHRGETEAASDDEYQRIISMTPLGSEDFLNAAFLRLDDVSEALRLANPDSALMAYTSATGLSGTLMIARVDTDGRVLWRSDTGIDRFKLSQILPGKNSMAFVGTRPPVPDKVSEPLLVIVDNQTGALVTHSLWQ